ncbi:hypothetical protein MMC18_008269 [Xylographa bjoerkii]|nr:hypothetical protein [Xylographa bjoerkii]
MSSSTTDNAIDPVLVIGLDFGTTFSGVAWTLSNDPGKLNIISSWNDKKGRKFNSRKVPSATGYDSSGSVASWGFDVDDKHRQPQWFKLSVSQTVKSQVIINCPEMTESVANMKLLKKSPLGIIEDYLSRLWNHAAIELQHQLGEASFKSYQRIVIFAVPTVWEPWTLRAMKEAVVHAGFLPDETNLVLVAEPEAAAFSIFADLNALGRPAL